MAAVRVIDYLFAIAIIVLFAIPSLLLIVIIRIDSAGPAIFAQKRVGRHGKIFTCYKFRTMASGTAVKPTHEITKRNVTRVGRFLRTTKLDELPQALNILRGEMSLVGPRPCLPSQFELIEERSKRGVMAVLPGITGLAQIHDIDMSAPRRLARWDSLYARNAGVSLYLYIVVATLFSIGMNDKTSQ